MKTNDKMREMSGTLHLRAFDKSGKEMWSDTGKNLIVASGYTAAAEALAGVSGAKIVSVAVGTNGEPPADTDTSIQNAVVLQVQSVEYPQPGTIRFNFTIGYNAAPGMNIREFGLLTEDGRLFSRKTREILEKSQYLTIVGMWEIKM